MRVVDRLVSMRAHPGKGMSLVLNVALFIIALGYYQMTSYERHQQNPDDKVLPGIAQIIEKGGNLAFEADSKGEYLLWKDLKASARRFSISFIFILGAVIVGLIMGCFPYFERLFLYFMIFFDKIPALALLPILFIAFGLGETSKIALITIGTFPTICLDTYLRAKGIPEEQKIKGFSLGATDAEVAFTIVLPQIWPDVLNTIRLNLKSVILFLIAGESLAATEGMGYRIFLVRRYMAMDTILSYVMIVSLIMYAMDFGIRWWISHRYEWHNNQ